MKSALTFLSVAMLACAIAVAQDASTTNSQTSQSSSTTTSSSTTQQTSTTEQNTTIQGCLSSSSMGDNAYKLTQDQTGTVYTLTGNLDELKSHVGHEVAITGQVTSSSSSATASSDNNTTGNQAASSKSGNNSLQVNSVKMISDHCASNGTPGPTGGANSGAAEPEVETTASQQPKTNPPTSSSLPLLGLLGLGSLIAGLFARR